jgi:hypothetical protein
VTENVPDALGVPEIVPLLALIVNPPGSPLAAHVYGGVPLPAETVVL